MPRRLRLLALVAVIAALSAGAGVAATGYAAGTSVASNRLSVFRPSALPPACSPHSQTLTAVADTYINQSAVGTNYGSSTTLGVNGRVNQNQRTLVRFTLPTAPTGCTMASATLRMNASSFTTARTLNVFRAGSAWAEDTVTWTSWTANASTSVGTAVTAASATGWVQWTVTTHVQSHYSGTNHGFVIRDSNETQNGQTPQVFVSKEAAANKPELVLQWQ